MPVKFKYKRIRRMDDKAAGNGKAKKRCKSCHRVHNGTAGSGGCKLYPRGNGKWTTVRPSRRKQLAAQKDASARASAKK